MFYFYLVFHIFFFHSFSLWSSLSLPDNNFFNTSLDNLADPLPIALPATGLTNATSIPSAPTTPQQSPPNILTAKQQTSSSALAPIALNTTTPITTPTNGTALGSQITNVVAPKGMVTIGPAQGVSNIPLTQTLQELLTNNNSTLSAYDQETCNLLRSGSIQQKGTVFARTHTDRNSPVNDPNSNACTIGAQQITAKNKFQKPAGAHLAARTSGISFTTHKKDVTLKNSLFKNSALDQDYNALLIQIKKYPSFIPLFTKFHILALSQLYQYLIGIYISLTLTHINDPETYILLEKAYGLNKKALIVQYLVNLVERQLNNALIELFPNLPKSFIVNAGLNSIESDHVSRLDLMFVNMEEVVLATFGVTSIKIEQWEVILNLLTSILYQKERTLVNQPLLEQISIKLTNYINQNKTNSSLNDSFIKKLLPVEKECLVDFLDILTEQFSTTQELTDCKHIVAMLQSKNYASLTQGEYTLLKNLISSYLLSKPLSYAIDTISALQKKLAHSNALSENITPEEFKFLHALLSFIAILFENTSFNKLYELQEVLKKFLEEKISLLSQKELKIFQYYKENCIYYKIKGKELALELQSNSNLLATLSSDQNTILNKNITFFQEAATLTNQQLSLLKQLTNAINTNNISTSDLIPEQRSLYEKILNFMTSYNFDSFTNNDAIKELNTIFGNNFNILTEAPLKEYTLESISNMKPSDLLVFYCVVNTGFHILKSAIDRHAKNVKIFECFNLYKNEITTPLFTEINYDNYENLVSVINLMDDSSASLNALTNKQKTLILNLLNVLVSSSTKPNNLPNVFNKIFLSINQNKKLTSFISEYTPLTNINIEKLSNNINNQNFTLSSLSPQEALFTSELLASYQNFLLHNTDSPKTPSSKTLTRGLNNIPHPLSSNDEQTALTVLSILHTEMNLKQSQNEMITSLIVVLNFFAMYTATLHNKPGDSISVIRKDFTEFAGYAHAIAQQLQNIQPGTTTPALFIYDKQTLEQLSFLPELAQSLRSTHSLFLPTQAIDMALLEHPVPTIMEPSPTNNQVILQKDVPYNIPSLLISNPDAPTTNFSPKFFFKDKDGKPFANDISLTFPEEPSNNKTTLSFVNPKINWLGKTLFPSNNPNKKATYQYYSVRPLEGEEGIYMNIPILKQDQGNKNNVLARLYEQKIIPQPAWLNKPEGVIAMIRACLGDFVTGLMLDDTIYDPIINYLLRYTLVMANYIPPEAGIPGQPQPFTIAELQKTLPFYEALSKDELIKTYVGPINTGVST